MGKALVSKRTGVLGPIPAVAALLLASVVALALAVAAALFMAAPAHAAAGCGQVLTANTTLNNDLLNCPGDGLIVGRSKITINLNGHTVDGVGLGVGIRNDGYDDVRITNTSGGPASVQEFDHGVQLNPGTLRNTVEKLTVQQNQIAGVQLSDADQNNQIKGNTIDRQSDDGIVLSSDSTGNVVLDNTISNNQGQGVLVQQSSSNRFESNDVTLSANRGMVFEGASGNTVLTNTLSENGDAGIDLQLGSNSNTVSRNTLSARGDAGIKVSDSNGNRLLTNTVRDCSDSGIFLERSNESTIRGNDVSFNPGGLELTSSDNNRVESNNASNTTGIGIELQDAANNELVLNTANDNNAQGIHSSGPVVSGLPAEGNLIDRNTTDSNSDGIVVATGGHTISYNTARYNSGWGISAAVGNTDGGGNRVSSNVRPEQCSGVICARDTGRDTIPPITLSVAPAEGVSSRPTSTKPAAVFSESMSPATVSTSTFAVSKRNPDGSYAKIAGTVTYDDTSKLATFVPSAPLAKGAKYKVNLSPAMKDRAGNALDVNPTTAGAQGKVWYFTTVN